MCAAFRYFHPHYIAESIHGWPHQWELEKQYFGGATGVLKSTGSIAGVCTVLAAVCTDSALLILFDYSKYFACLYRGYCLYSGFCTAYTLCSRSIPSALSILPAVRAVFRSPVLRVYSEYEAYREHLRNIFHSTLPYLEPVPNYSTPLGYERLHVLLAQV